MQLARRDKAVTTVVAFATDDADAPRFRILFKAELRHRGAGILHQGERRDAVALGGDPIDLAHLGGGDDFHRWRLNFEASVMIMHCPPVAGWATVAEFNRRT